MKGTFFAKPLEWNLNITGDAWQQGQVISGEMTLKNHGTETLSLSNVSLSLAQGDIKKVHSRDPKAFKVIESLPFQIKELAPGATHTQSFQLTLPPNCAVTDKKTSFYIAYGKEHEANLQLKVEPRKIFIEVTKLMETFQRFKTKDIKAAKAGVEFKLLPPTSREWAHVESLLLTQSVEGDNLVMDFLFNVKTIDTTSITTALAKETRQSKKILAPKEYSFGKDMINQDGIMKALDSALLEVKSKGI